MRRITFIGLWIIAASSGIQAQCSQDQILGTWVNQEGTSHIEIYQQAGKFHGKIVWINAPNDKDPQSFTDRNNPDPNLRHRSILGLNLISDLSYTDCKWTQGKIYSPKAGKTADCSATLRDPNTLELSAIKYWFSTTKKFTRL